MEQDQKSIKNTIANIKVPGIATMDYWSIIQTNEAIYFVKSGTALGLGVGTNSAMLIASVAGDIIESQRSKKEAQKDINSILNCAEEYIRFTPDQFSSIKIKKRIFGGKIIFPNGKEKSWKEAGFVKFKLSPKKFKTLLSMLS